MDDQVLKVIWHPWNMWWFSPAAFVFHDPDDKLITRGTNIEVRQWGRRHSG